MVFLKKIYDKVDFEKNQQTTKKPEKLPSRQRFKLTLYEKINPPALTQAYATNKNIKYIATKLKEYTNIKMRKKLRI